MASAAYLLPVSDMARMCELELDVPFAVWRIDLSQAPDAAGMATLSQAERQRADRFRKPCNARRYLAAHAGLRYVLEEYSGIAAADQRFVHNELGKPVLEQVADWQFNLSYAGDSALLVLDFDRALGVDIELDRPIADIDALAILHLADREREALSRRCLADRSSAFLCAWTRKEACLKAWGCGLQREPGGIETGIDPVTMELSHGTDPALTLGSFRIEDDLIGAWAQI